MDNNPATQMPQAPMPSINPEPMPSSKKNIWIFLVVGIFVLVAIGGGTVWYMMSSQKTTSTAQTAPAVDVEDLKNEANSVPDANLDDDFKQVDSDLQSL